MKKWMYGLAALALIPLIALVPAGPEGLEIGESSPAFAKEVTDLSGKKAMLRSFNGGGGMLVVFSCNTCPFVVAWEDRYNELHELCKKNDIGMVLVNSNEAYRDKDDSMDAMKAHAKELGYTMPYVVDANHAIADAFGARTTPHVFLFNRDLNLVYKGAIDDNYKDKGAVKEKYLENAVTAMAAGNTVEPNSTKALGCSIKRMKR